MRLVAAVVGTLLALEGCKSVSREQTGSVDVHAAAVRDLCPVPDVCDATTKCGAGRGCERGCCAPESVVASVPFTQASPVTPGGHEVITVRAADSLRDSRLRPRDLEIDSRVGCVACDRYATRSLLVWSTVMGQRWVDIMGFRAGPTFPAQERCLNAVAQDPDDVQYDHFLRRRGDEGERGRIRAIAEATARFRTYFVNAVLTPSDQLIDFVDGGATQVAFKARRGAFLFGRAAHLFQDSFSAAHAVRLEQDGYRIVHDIKTYVCTSGAPVHPHVSPVDLVLGRVTYDAAPDVIWTDKAETDLKPTAKAAVSAMADLWRAFLSAESVSTAERRRRAEREVDQVIAIWLSVGGAVPSEGSLAGGSVSCATEEDIERTRKACLKETGYEAEGTRPPVFWKRLIFSDIP